MATYKFRTRPYRHQVEALKVLLRNEGGALFMEMGTGKTKVGIDWAAAESIRVNPHRPNIRALVVSPLSVVGVWWKEIAKHDPFYDLVTGPLWRVINYDVVWRQQYFEDLVNWLLEVEPHERLIIADESHRIKKHSTRRAKGMHKLGQVATKKAIMSGTPITNKGPLDAFSQFKFVDESIFGSRFEAFKRMVAVYKWGSPVVLRYKNFRWVSRKTKHLTFRITKDECLDLPPTSHTKVPVALEPKSRRVYEELAHEAVAEFEGHQLETPHVLARLTRLQQITGGWFKTEEAYSRISRAKLNTYTDLLTTMKENERQKVVVFCRFKKELWDIRRASMQVGYRVLTVRGGNRKYRERIYAAFEESKENVVLVCMLATGAEGRNELVVAREAIFYSCNYSFDNFDQALARLDRPGQKHKVTYYHLLVEDSIDGVVLDSLREKRDLAELVLQYPRLLYSSAATAKAKER